MVFSYNWLQNFFKEKLPKPEKLAEILTLRSFEIKSVKKQEKDFILDIDVLPNRAGDCLSYLGMAREIAVILNLKFKIQNSKPPRTNCFAILQGKQFKSQNLKIGDFLKVEVKNKIACSRYTACLIANVRIGPSPKWLQERLRVCGMKPINNVVDATNYVLLETGQPLHAFDFDKLANLRELSANNTNIREIRGKIRDYSRKIIIRFAKKGEKITTLDNEKYELDEDILVIADAKEPLAIAGIKGGKKAEIGPETKNIILEAANFDKFLIYKNSKRLNLETESAKRFKYGLDPNLAPFAIKRTAQIIAEIAGGEIIDGMIDICFQKTGLKIIKLDLNYVKNLLGIEISEKEIKSILQKLGFRYYAPSRTIENCSQYINVEAPTFRLDISIQEDLIEEIGRLHGYQKIPALFPIVSLIPPKKNNEIFWENIIKNTLKNAGFNEVYNYSFISENDAEIFREKRLVELENPISVEQRYLRHSLIPNLLKDVRINQAQRKEIKIFEIGKVFKRCSAANKQISEKRMLTGLMTGDKFYEAKGVVDLVLNNLGISQIWYDEYQPTPEQSKDSIWQMDKCAEIKIDNKEIGFLGEISLEVAKKMKKTHLQTEEKTIVFDLDFEELLKLVSENQEYQPISLYPSAVRDLAILVPLRIKVEEVLNKIEITGGILLRDVDLFDIYEGEELPNGKKNLAFHLIYQADDRTLTADEIDEIQNKIIRVLEQEPEWEVRK